MKMNSLSITQAGKAVLAGTFAVFALSGCYTSDGRPDNTATGALVGGASGAATGALIGSGSHSAGEGALIGAAAGTVLGALIGHSADDAQAARFRQEYPDTYARAQQGAPLSPADVKAMTRAGL